MSTHFSRKRSTIVGIGVAALAAGGIALGASFASASENDATKPDLALLSKAASPADALPKWYVDGPGGEFLDLKTVRAVDVTDGTGFWTARNRAGEVCLVNMVPGEMAGTACATPKEFNAHGVGVRVSVPAAAVEAYLVPDSVARASNVVHAVDKGATATATSSAVTSQLDAAAVKEAGFELRLVDSTGDLFGH